MEINPIRIYGDDDIHEKTTTNENDTEVNLPDVKECSLEEFDSVEDINNIIEDPEPEEKEQCIKKKNSLFGGLDTQQKQKQTTGGGVSIIYIAMGLGLVKFLI